MQWLNRLAPFCALALLCLIGLAALNRPGAEDAEPYHQRVREAAEKLYRELVDAGIEVLFDDRDARPGVMFADMELIGIPHRVVIGERGLDKGQVEYRGRRDSDNEMLPLETFVSFMRDRLTAEVESAVP